MDEKMLKRIANDATTVLSWYEADAKAFGIPRAALVEQFIDTLNALEQAREQED